jgi:hypothetical protein
MSTAHQLDTDAAAVATAPGVTLRKLRSGEHGWEIRVPAEGSSQEELRAAAEIAQQIDVELAEAYPDPEPEAAPERKTRKRTKGRSWGEEPASAKQLDYIQKLADGFGLHVDPPTDQGAATTLIRRLLRESNGSARRDVA